MACQNDNERERERFCQYLAEIVDALEIHCTISAPSQEILKKVILGEVSQTVTEHL
ncbi:hypothetical protein K443DRAFT_15547 [Laccaria amethystina LaAM-08-1]|uniref:Uncharacterized protein n=1 Tax=Laccaria amethystina LaAM-08-1 TaxID=1095629 RepID=A0A0C9WGV0_9AGAR|nr:hypothetical protein K443DRAFT_15547 [Laccaria amethystina LaAM-08-1]